MGQVLSVIYHRDVLQLALFACRVIFASMPQHVFDIF